MALPTRAAAGVGSLGWAHRTGGRISARDRFELMRQLVLLELGARLRRGGGAPAVRIDVDALTLPDSAAAKAAEAQAEELLEPFLLNHSVRTYVWGSLLGGRGGLDFDAEALYVAAMLHDIGLADAVAVDGTRDPCFTLAGARAAEALAGSEGWDGRRAAVAADAITVHMNLLVPPARGHEAHLLTAGAACDVTGARLTEIHPDTRDDVLERWPRHRFKQAFTACFVREHERRPGTRTAFFMAPRFGLPKRIDDAPYAE